MANIAQLFTVKKSDYRGLYMTLGGVIAGWVLSPGRMSFVNAYRGARPVLESHFIDAPIPCNENGVK